MNNLTNRKKDKTIDKVVQQLRDKIEKRGPLPYATVERQLDLVEQLQDFEFGRHMLLHQGAVDGYWTYYAIRHNLSPFPNLTPLERFMFEKTPYMKATFQTFLAIQAVCQKQLKEGIFLASIPSGVMADLLTLDFSSIKQFELMGVDIDLKSNRYAQDFAFERGLSSHVHFYERDAWKLGLKETCDGIVCNGLNCYEPDETKQQALYHQLYDALKPAGFLVVSYLTPPPGKYHRCEWLIDKLSMEDMLLQQLLYFDILDSCWQAFQTTDQMKALLETAGFERIDITYDEARLMPIAVAWK